MRKKIYVAVKDFSLEAQKMLTEVGFEVDINQTWDAPNGETLVRILEDYDIVITGVATKYTSEILANIKTPKIIASFSVGLDHISPEFFQNDLVKIVNIKTANSEAVAEHVFGLMLALSKRIVEGENLVYSGRGHKKNLVERPKDLFDQTLGLIGAGNITAEIIKIAKCFNMKLLCWTRHPEKHCDLDVKFVDLESLLRLSDIANVSLPLNNETYGLISRDKLKLFKKSSMLICTSREEILDMDAVFELADHNKSFYVGLDVDVTDKNKILLEKPRRNVIVTPHTAGVSEQAIYNMDIEISQKIIEAFI